jgi:hypothetical protein
MTTTTTSCATRKSGGTPHVVAALIAGIIATGGVAPWLIQEGYPADAVGGAFLIGMLATLVVGSTLMAPEDKALKRVETPTLHRVLAHADEHGYSEVVLLPRERPAFYRPDGTRADDTWTLRTHKG